MTLTSSGEDNIAFDDPDSPSGVAPHAEGSSGVAPHAEGAPGDDHRVHDEGHAGRTGHRPSVVSLSEFLSVEAPEGNKDVHTYVYEPQMSFSGMTLEALPEESNYRDLKNLQLGGKGRPTIEELKSGQVQKAQEPDEPVLVKKGKMIKLGWVKGVFIKCALNIWGVMLFLRLTAVIGQCGMLQGLILICLANVVTAITSVSMSAVATNGMIPGGGIYYMISRSLGPEFGGAIGIMFTLANAIAVATYLIGFCNSLLDCLNQYIPNFDGIVGTMENPNNDIRIIATGVLILILGLVIVGLDWVSRVDIALLILLLAAQLDVLVGSFMPAEEEKKFGFIGYSSKVISKNFANTNFHENSNPDKSIGFFYWFGVYFPAVTGIVAGANMSGDLKDPAAAIPKGTLLAVFVTFVAYFTFGVVTGSVYLTEASGDENEYWATINGTTDGITGPMFFDDCNATLREKPCLYGSSNDQQTMTKISYTGYLVYAGCFAATLSSAIASLVGAPRVLQAVAKDNLFPFLGFFAKGRGPNNDPVRGYILIFFVSLGCTMIAELNVVGTLLSNFFVAAYALINLSVFFASFSKSPGWRPSFKYYNKWISLFGTFLCIAVMFLINWITALITLFCIAILFLFILYYKPEANWGSSAQAQQFLSTLKGVQNMQEYREEHVKNYRPKILVLSGIPAHRVALVDFANLITKNISLLICAHVAKDLPVSYFKNLKENVAMWLKDHNVKGFFSITSNNNFEDGAISLMNLTGLGHLSPNMVLMGYKSDWHKNANEADQYYNVINHAFDLHLAIGILRLKNNCDYSNVISVEETMIVPVVKEKSSSKTKSVAKMKAKSIKKPKKYQRTVIYQGPDGRPLPRTIIAELTQFKEKVRRKGTVDIWWLYDDGGLTLLLPYILRTRSQFQDCHFRVFSLANRKEELDQETRSLIQLLTKFRVSFSDVTIIPDVTAKARKETKSEFKDILQESSCSVADGDLMLHKTKTNRHLRLTELLRENSTGAEMVVMSLPMPRKGAIPTGLYLAWLEIMTRNMPPFLLIRGNQTSVLTFYS